MHNLAKYKPPTSMKGNSFDEASWKVRNKELSVYENRVAIKDGLPSSMQDNLEDNKEDYRPLTHEYWCDLLYKIEVKYNSKRAATQIKGI